MDLSNSDYQTLNLLHGPTMKLNELAGSKNGKNNLVSNDILQERAKEFEAIFLSEMLKPMWKGLETDGYFGGGQTEEIFRSMLVDEYAKNIAYQDNGIGISDAILKELTMMNAQNVTETEIE